MEPLVLLVTRLLILHGGYCELIHQLFLIEEFALVLRRILNDPLFLGERSALERALNLCLRAVL